MSHKRSEFGGLLVVAGLGALAYAGYRLRNTILEFGASVGLRPKASSRESTASEGPTVTGNDHDRSTGLLAAAVKAGNVPAVTWVEVPMGDLILTVGVDPLKLDGLRMPVSWPETIAIAKSQGWVAPSKRIADAIYKAASVKTAFHSLVTDKDPESGGEKMHTLEFTKKYNTDVDKQLADAGWDGSTLQSGAEKYWLLSKRLTENSPHSGKPAAINYGAWTAAGKPQQSPSAAHDINYVGDYSQLFRAIKRYAKDKDGHKIDLLDWMVINDEVPSQFADKFRQDEELAA